MPRRPNFNYERSQRDRAKAAKRDAKREARAARKSGDPVPEVSDAPIDDGQPRPNVVLSAAPPEAPAASEAREAADAPSAPAASEASDTKNDD